MFPPFPAAFEFTEDEDDAIVAEVDHENPATTEATAPVDDNEE